RKRHRFDDFVPLFETGTARPFDSHPDSLVRHAKLDRTLCVSYNYRSINIYSGRPNGCSNRIGYYWLSQYKSSNCKPWKKVEDGIGPLGQPPIPIAIGTQRGN